MALWHGTPASRPRDRGRQPLLPAASRDAPQPPNPTLQESAVSAKDLGLGVLRELKELRRRVADGLRRAGWEGRGRACRRCPSLGTRAFPRPNLPGHACHAIPRHTQTIRSEAPRPPSSNHVPLPPPPHVVREPGAGHHEAALAALQDAIQRAMHVVAWHAIPIHAVSRRILAVNRAVSLPRPQLIAGKGAVGNHLPRPRVTPSTPQINPLSAAFHAHKTD